MNRPASKAGSWYSGEANLLRAEVAGCVGQAEEKYASALAENVGDPVAIVVPHAGLYFSGTLAGLGFELVRRRRESVETFIIFGACHRERLLHPAVWTGDAWDCPLGAVEVDNALARELVAAGVGRSNTRPHADDNAIELQLPFVKVLFPNAKIVPIAMGFFPDSYRYGEIAAQVAGKKNVVVVASTDLTHYGASFGVAPAGYGETALAWTKANDQRFIETLVDLNMEKIVSTAEKEHSACGAGAAAAAAGWAKALGCEKGRLLAHTNSYEILPRGNADHIVGYATVAFET